MCEFMSGQFGVLAVIGAVCTVLLHVFGVCVVVVVALFAATVVYCARAPSATVGRIFRDDLSRVLFLIAHPDDECE
jgi:hypothetical protein